MNESEGKELVTKHALKVHKFGLLYQWTKDKYLPSDPRRHCTGPFMGTLEI